MKRGNVVGVMSVKLVLDKPVVQGRIRSAANHFFGPGTKGGRTHGEKLGAQIGQSGTYRLRHDATANIVPLIQEQDAQTGVKRLGGHQPGHAGADNQYVNEIMAHAKRFTPTCGDSKLKI